MATLTFHGAAQEVTGSCHKIDTKAGSLLLDCGLITAETAYIRADDRESFAHRCTPEFLAQAKLESLEGE